MKVLMIGMDGVQLDTFRRGWTPFIASLIDGGQSLTLTEDIISRGWVEIFTGRHGTETGGLYERPVLDGSYRWTDKCTLVGIPGIGESIKPLWQVLNDRGHRVGVMNVPTTNPAPPVNGFFVSGGGGGRGVSQDVAEEQCHPTSIKEKLDSMGYIVDERLGSLLNEKQLYEAKDFFKRIGDMDELRCRSFSNLAEEFRIDFGFVVNRSTVMAESFLLPELSRRDRGLRHNSSLIESGEKFYRRLDAAVESMVNAFSNAQVILVSDHGTHERNYSVNFNSLLTELGYQQPVVGRKSLYYILKKLRNRLPEAIVRQAKKNKRATLAVRSITSFDTVRTQAFNITHHQANHGIFINDEKRFGGPVKETERLEIASKIVGDFNRHPVCMKHGMVALIPIVPEGAFLESYPDVYVSLPEGYTPSNEKDRFLWEYEWRNEPIDLRTIRQNGGRVSVKGHCPLAVVCGEEWLVKPTQIRGDLRLVYDHILNFFE